MHNEAKWCATTIGRLLSNEKYKGALLMQKTFTANYLTKQNLRNTGQLNQYYIEDNHPAIIPPEIWDAFNHIVARRGEMLPVWQELLLSGTPLQKVRARQMMETTASGPILYEIPELTQAILQEAWAELDGNVRFRFLVETSE